jgi:hypothetical protein
VLPRANLGCSRRTPERLSDAIDLLAPDFVQTDRRRGPPNPELVGRRARLEVLASFLDPFGTEPGR